MTTIIIERNGSVARASCHFAHDRAGYIGIRESGARSTIYVPVGDLEYAIDEAYRAVAAATGAGVTITHTDAATLIEKALERGDDIVGGPKP